MQAVLSSWRIGTISLAQHVRDRTHRLIILPLDQLKAGMPARAGICWSLRWPDYRFCRNMLRSPVSFRRHRTWPRVIDGFGSRQSGKVSCHDRAAELTGAGSEPSPALQHRQVVVEFGDDWMRYGLAVDANPFVFRFSGLFQVFVSDLPCFPFERVGVPLDTTSPAACPTVPQSTDHCPAVRLRRKSRSVLGRGCRPSCQRSVSGWFPPEGGPFPPSSANCTPIARERHGRGRRMVVP